MIKYLHRLKRNKGFTLVELVVVICIITVLLGVMLIPLLGGNTEDIMAANSNAEVFMSACQLAFTRAQFAGRSLVKYEDTDTKFIEYKDGANNIIDGKYLFLEARFKQNGMEWLHIDTTFNGLMSASKAEDREMTELEEYFAASIDKCLAGGYNGYFYAMIDNNFTVRCTHFCDRRLPIYKDDGDLTALRDSLMVYNGKVVGNGRIIGSCSDVCTAAGYGDDTDDEKPNRNAYVFAIPTQNDSEIDFSKYLD